MAQHDTLMEIKARWRNLLLGHPDMDMTTKLLISLFLDDLIRMGREAPASDTITVREMRARGEMEQSP